MKMGFDDVLYRLSGSFADPNFRLHKPELRSYECLIYEQQVILLLSYLTVDRPSLQASTCNI